MRNSYLFFVLVASMLNDDVKMTGKISRWRRSRAQKSPCV